MVLKVNLVIDFDFSLALFKPNNTELPPLSLPRMGRFMAGEKSKKNFHRINGFLSLKLELRMKLRLRLRLTNCS